MVASTTGMARGWGVNFGAILLCHLFIFSMFNSIMPFLPLYLRELGEDESGAVFWTGMMQATASGILIVTTPLWGALADRVGRKPMVARALVGSAVVFLLMIFTTQAWQLLALRALQGATAGTNAAVIALAVSVLPPSRLGLGMGMLQTAQFLGLSLGPLLGGLSVAAFGFKTTLGLSAACLFLVALVVVLGIKEPPLRATPRGEAISLKQRLAMIGRLPGLRAPILAMLAFQASYSSGVTLLPLHLHAVMGGSTESETSAAIGLVLSSTALGIALGATVLGWLGGRLGVQRVALGSMLAAALFTLPQIWFQEQWQFISMRFLLGFAAGGVLPSLRAALGEAASRSERVGANLGAMYGLAQSGTSAGMALGPLVAAGAATAWGLPATHAVSAALLVVAAVWWRRTAGTTVAPNLEPPGRARGSEP